MLWVIIDILRCADLHNLSCIHDRYAIRNPGDRSQIMRHKYDRDPCLIAQFTKKIENLCLHGNVKSGCRFVCQQEFRPHRQRYRYDTSLTHTARKEMRLELQALFWVWYPDKSQHLNSTLPCRRSAHITVFQDGLYDLFTDRNGRIQGQHRILEYHRDIPTAQAPHLFFCKR